MELVPIIGGYYGNWRYVSLSNFKFYDKWFILHHITGPLRWYPPLTKGFSLPKGL